MVDILGLETALRAATTIIKIVFVFVFGLCHSGTVSTIERSQKDKTLGFLGFGIITGHMAVGEMSELTWGPRT